MCDAIHKNMACHEYKEMNEESGAALKNLKEMEGIEVLIKIFINFFLN